MILFMLKRLLQRTRQTFVYQTFALPTFLWTVFLSFKVLDPYPFLLISGCHINLSYLTVGMYLHTIIKCVFLLLICLMLIMRSAKEPRRGERKKIPPLQCYYFLLPYLGVHILYDNWMVCLFFLFSLDFPGHNFWSWILNSLANLSLWYHISSFLDILYKVLQIPVVYTNNNNNNS